MPILYRGPLVAPDSNVKWNGPEMIIQDAAGVDPRVSPGIAAPLNSVCSWPDTDPENPRQFLKTGTANTAWSELPLWYRQSYTIPNDTTDTVTISISGTKVVNFRGRLLNRTAAWVDCYATFPGTVYTDAEYATRGYVDGHLGVGDPADGTEWQWPADAFYSGAGPSEAMGYGHLGLTKGLFFGRCAPSVYLSFSAQLDPRVGHNRFMEARAMSGKAGVFQPAYFFGQHLVSSWANTATAKTSVTMHFKFTTGDVIEWWEDP